MDYLTNPEDAAIRACSDPGEHEGMTQHRKVTLLRDLIRTGERKAFDMVHITVTELTTVYAALEIASRFPGLSDVNIAGEAPPTEGFLKADRTGLFHADSVEMEQRAITLRDTLTEVTHSMIAAGVNIGQAIEQGSMYSGATVTTRGSVLDYYQLYRQMHPTVHPFVVHFAHDAWSDLVARYPAMTQAIREGVAA
jgi:hypothetical protein